MKILCFEIDIRYVGFKTKWKSLALDRQKIQAIKAYQEKHHCSLKEAKRVVDKFMIEEGISLYYPYD